MRITIWFAAAALAGVFGTVCAQNINGCQQLVNRGFELFDNEDDNGTKGTIEPVGWNSFMTATTVGGLVDQGKARRVEKKTDDKRPGSAGSACIRLFSTAILGVNANGLVTTGRVNMGSATATDASNHAYTDRTHEGFYTTFTAVPDSMVIWAKYIPEKTSIGQLQAIIHDDFEMWDPWTAGMLNHAVAMATVNPEKKDGGWHRYSVPFKKDGCASNTPLYILVSATTNSKPGGDQAQVFLDDILFVYNPDIKAGSLPAGSFNLRDGAPAFDLAYTLSGTVAWNTDDAVKNKVIAELSDASGHFGDYPTFLAELETDESGVLHIQIPDNLAQGDNYAIRIRTTERKVQDVIQNISFIYGYNINVETDGGGTVSGKAALRLGSRAMVKAVPNVGYHFVRWEEKGLPVDNAGAEYAFTVDGDRNLKAVFERNSYLLTVNVEGEGTVNPAAGVHTYLYMDKVDVSAVAADEFQLEGFYRGDALLSRNSPCTLTISNNDAVTVKFREKQKVVEAVSNSASLGSVSGGGLYDKGSRITLAASAMPFCYFIGWMQGTDTVSKQPRYEFTVEKSVKLTALFGETFYSVSAASYPAGAADITGTGVFSAAKPDVSILLNAQAKGGYEFLYWKEDGTDEEIYENPYLYLDGARLTRNVSFTAWFNPVLYRVEAALEDIASGVVVSGPGEYMYGNEAVLEVECAEGYEFVEWTSGGVSVSAQNPYTVAVQGNASFTARLKKKTYNIVLGTEPENLGTVSGEGTYSHGDTVRMEAVAAGGYVFSHWAVKSGINFNEASKQNPWIYTARGNGEYYAVFVPRPKSVQVVSIPEGAGNVTGAGSYTAGVYATLRAYDTYGYHFSSWVHPDTTRAYLNSTLRLLVEGDTVVRALYIPNNFNLLVMTEGAQTTGVISVNGSSYGTLHEEGVLYNQQVVLKAKPQKRGYAFWQWRVSYNDNGTVKDSLYSKQDSIVFTVKGDATLTGYFVEDAYSVKAGAVLEGSSLPASPAQAVSSTYFGHIENEGNYRNGNWAALEAVAAPGYAFSRWVRTTGEEFVKDRNTLLITVVKDTVVYGLFKPDTLQVSLRSVSHPDWGSVSGSGLYKYGDTAVLKALPAKGYRFAGWRYDKENAASYVYMKPEWKCEVKKNMCYSAEFLPESYTVSAGVEPAQAGSVKGQGVYGYMEEALLTAASSHGYEFAGWVLEKPDGTGNDTIGYYVFPLAVRGNVFVKALFKPVSVRWEARSENPAMGGVMPTSCGYARLGETVEFAAVPSPDHRFVNWKNAEGRTVSNLSVLPVKLSGDTLLYASFAGKTVRMNAQSADPQKGYIEAYNNRVEYGSQLSLQASPMPGYVFEKWTTVSGHQVSLSDLLTVVMWRDTAFTAHFVPAAYKVELEVKPQGGGKARMEFNGADVPEKTTVVNGAEIELYAEPAPHYSFSGFKEGSRTLDKNGFTVGGPVRITAEFKADEYVLKLEVEPAGYGSVSGEGAFGYGSPALIKAVPGNQYAFVGWKSGDNWISKARETEFYLQSDTLLTAVFSLDSITVNLESQWGGTTRGSGVYASGTEAVLEAVAYSGYEFAGWKDASSGETVSTENPYVIKVDGNIDYRAEFKGRQLDITLTSTPGGSVSGGGGIMYGTTAGLFAVADPGYLFAGWKDEARVLTPAQRSVPYVAFEAVQNVELEATFIPDRYEVSIESSPLGAGKTSEGGKFDFGAQLRFEAEPDANHLFAGWFKNGELVESAMQLDVTVSDNEKYIAVFEPKQVRTSVVVSPKGSGVALGSGIYYYGDSIKVGVQPYSGYTFSHWMDGNFVSISTLQTFTRQILYNDLFTAVLKNTGGQTGIQPPLALPSCTLYPNPVGKNRILHLEASQAGLQYIRMYSLGGVMVYYKKFSNDGTGQAEIKLPDWLSGYYFYELGFAGGSTCKGKLSVL